MQKIRDYEDHLMSVGYSRRVAKDLAPKLQRRIELAELAALFAGDPTALVAALRLMGVPAPARYARARRVAQ